MIHVSRILCTSVGVRRIRGWLPRPGRLGRKLGTATLDDEMERMFKRSPDAVRCLSTGEGDARQLTTAGAVAAGTKDVDLATVAAAAGIR